MKTVTFQLFLCESFLFSKRVLVFQGQLMLSCGWAWLLNGGFLLVGNCRKVFRENSLKRRGNTSEAISDICVLCEEEAESISHLFIHCKVTSLI